MAWSPRTPRLPLYWADRPHRYGTLLVPLRQRQLPLHGVETTYQHLKNDGWARRHLAPNLDAGSAAVPDQS